MFATRPVCASRVSAPTPGPRASARLGFGAPLAGLALALLVGCNTPKTNENCDGIPTGIEQDVCMGKRLKETPAAEVDLAIERAKKIRDPMVKGEAVSSWVEAHANEIPPHQGQKLCSMLEGRDGAPHLQD